MSQIAMEDVFEDESDRRSAAIVRPQALTLERRRYDDRLLVTMTPLTAALLSDIDRIVASQGPDDDDNNTFWHNLGKVHRDKIARYGFETFKRHINFGYGSWQITKFSSRFTLFCLYALMRRGRLPKVARIDWDDVKPMPVWGEAVSDRNSPEQRLRAYAFWCGLIWQYSALNDKVGCLRVAEPSLGAPMPVWLNGRLISQDLALAALDINVMARVVPLYNVHRVLEIGAGYGKLAYVFTSLFPDADYTIADIAPALAVSRNYLPAVTSGKNLRFVLPHELDQLPDKHFDLAINISSLDEMPPTVQKRYLKRIDRLCRGHLYLAGYGKHLGERVGLNDLPYDPRWIALYDQPHEVFPLWVEKVFSVP